MDQSAEDRSAFEEFKELEDPPISQNRSQLYELDLDEIQRSELLCQHSPNCCSSQDHSECIPNRTGKRIIEQRQQSRESALETLKADDDHKRQAFSCAAKFHKENQLVDKRLINQRADEVTDTVKPPLDIE